MNTKQFEILQQSVQWVVDEARRLQTDQVTGDREHLQMEWAIGLATGVQVRDRFEVLCTTACCLAGNAVLVAGDQMVVRKSDLEFALLDDDITTNLCVTAEGNVRDISQRAQELMGLHQDQATALFDAENGWQTIVVYATEYAAEHGHELVVI